MSDAQSDVVDDRPEPMVLTHEEIRVMGCLLEKARTTPDDYPLSRNALMRACNQSTNREPVVAYDESLVGATLDSLKSRRLVRFVHQASGRGVTKYRHVADEVWGLNEQECAVICLLALRGPQTAGELRTRSERLTRFESIEQVEAALERLADRSPSLVVQLERRPGQKEARWAHLLAGAVVEDSGAGGVGRSTGVASNVASRIEQLEGRVLHLEQLVSRLLGELGLEDADSTSGEPEGTPIGD